MKQFIMVLCMMIFGAPSLMAQSIEDMRQMCISECGRLTWEIAIPYGAYELTREEDTLNVAVLVAPSRQGYFTLWTASMPADPSGVLEPDPEWLQQQPPRVILEWTLEETPYAYQPGEVTYQVVPDGSRRSNGSSPTAVQCDCELYHEGLRESGSTDEATWSFYRTSDRGLLWSPESFCYEQELRDWLDVLSNSEYIGWVKPPGEDVWYSIRDAHRSNTLEMVGTWEVRTRNCPPEELRDRSSVD